MPVAVVVVDVLGDEPTREAVIDAAGTTQRPSLTLLTTAKVIAM